MKEALGLDPIFTPVMSRPSGMKFAVTATTISDATLCLMSNYNGEVSHGKDLSTSGQSRTLTPTNERTGYKHLRAAQADDELSLWEA